MLYEISLISTNLMRIQNRQVLPEFESTKKAEQIRTIKQAYHLERRFFQ